MKKKIIAIVISVLLLVVALTGCNKLKQTPLAAVPSDAVVSSNGGMSVKVGNYIYFINGYVGLTNIDNTFGKPIKSAIYRIAVNADGSMVENSVELVAPKNVVSSYANGGIYVYDGWIYYATPNTDKDKSGAENTTYLDFFRTKLDASLTEKIATTNSRSAQYMFAKGYLVYVQDSSIYSVNCDDKKSTVVTDGNLTTAQFVNTTNDGEYDGYIFFTRKLPDEKKTETYNEYCATKVGSGEVKVLITGDTYTQNKAEVKKIFSISPIGYVAEADGVAVYYTKSYTAGTSSTAVSVGTFCYKFDSSVTFTAANEKQLSTTALSAITPISYEKGVLVLENSLVNRYDFSSFNVTTIVGRSVTVKFVYNNYLYYTNSSSITTLFRIDMTNENAVEEQVLTDNFATTWLGFEECDGYVYYFDTDYNYAYRYNLNGAVLGEPELVGKMTAEDIAAIEEAEKNS